MGGKLAYNKTAWLGRARINDGCLCIHGHPCCGVHFLCYDDGDGPPKEQRCEGCGAYLWPGRAVPSLWMIPEAMRMKPGAGPVRVRISMEPANGGDGK